MSPLKTVVELDIEGTAAPPRVNGEMVFEAPWEGRAFGLVMTLCERNVIEWEVFSRATDWRDRALGERPGIKT